MYVHRCMYAAIYAMQVYKKKCCNRVFGEKGKFIQITLTPPHPIHARQKRKKKKKKIREKATNENQSQSTSHHTKVNPDPPFISN